MRCNNRIMLGVAILAACLLFDMPVYGTSASSQLQEAQNKKQQAENKIDDAKDTISDLNDERASLQQYVDELNSQLQTASMELSELENLISEKEQDISNTERELEEAKEAQEEQYLAMRRRIKFMYECGDSTYLELLFTSSGFSDFLNKNEYFVKLTEYDRKMLQEYVELQDEIKREESDLKDARTALQSLRGEADEKADGVAGIVKEASENLNKYLDQISEQEKQMLAYEQELNAANNDIKNLQAQLAADQKLTQNSVMRDLSSVSISSGDIDLMAAIIECEAGGESYTGKVAVGAVVMNRVKSSSFPNTILEVIYQNKQFSPVASGRFAVVLARGANETCYQAARDAMSGVSPVGDKLFFRTPIPGLVGQQIGGHIFY